MRPIRRQRLIFEPWFSSCRALRQVGPCAAILSAAPTVLCRGPSRARRGVPRCLLDQMRRFALLECAGALRQKPHGEAAKLRRQWVEVPIVTGDGRSVIERSARLAFSVGVCKRDRLHRVQRSIIDHRPCSRRRWLQEASKSPKRSLVFPFAVVKFILRSQWNGGFGVHSRPSQGEPRWRALRHSRRSAEAPTNACFGRNSARSRRSFTCAVCGRELQRQLYVTPAVRLAQMGTIHRRRGERGNRTPCRHFS